MFLFQGSEETVPDVGRKQILWVAGSDREQAAAGQPGPSCCGLQAGSRVTFLGSRRKGRWVKGLLLLLLLSPKELSHVCVHSQGRGRKSRNLLGECSCKSLASGFSSFFLVKTHFQLKSVSSALPCCQVCLLEASVRQMHIMWYKTDWNSCSVKVCVLSLSTHLTFC